MANHASLASTHSIDDLDSGVYLPDVDTTPASTAHAAMALASSNQTSPHAAANQVAEAAASPGNPHFLPSSATANHMDNVAFPNDDLFTADRCTSAAFTHSASAGNYPIQSAAVGIATASATSAAATGFTPTARPFHVPPDPSSLVNRPSGADSTAPATSRGKRSASVRQGKKPAKSARRTVGPAVSNSTHDALPPDPLAHGHHVADFAGPASISAEPQPPHHVAGNPHPLDRTVLRQMARSAIEGLRKQLCATEMAHFEKWDEILPPTSYEGGELPSFLDQDSLDKVHRKLHFFRHSRKQVVLLQTRFVIWDGQKGRVILNGGNKGRATKSRICAPDCPPGHWPALEADISIFDVSGRRYQNTTEDVESPDAEEDDDNYYPTGNVETCWKAGLTEDLPCAGFLVLQLQNQSRSFHSEFYVPFEKRGKSVACEIRSRSSQNIDMMQGRPPFPQFPALSMSE